MVALNSVRYTGKDHSAAALPGSQDQPSNQVRQMNGCCFCGIRKQGGGCKPRQRVDLEETQLRWLCAHLRSANNKINPRRVPAAQVFVNGYRDLLGQINPVGRQAGGNNVFTSAGGIFVLVVVPGTQRCCDLNHWKGDGVLFFPNAIFPGTENNKLVVIIKDHFMHILSTIVHW